MPRTKQKSGMKKRKRRREKNVHEDVNINRDIDQTHQKAQKMLASLTSSSENAGPITK